jgi:hypothetical protein
LRTSAFFAFFVGLSDPAVGWTLFFWANFDFCNNAFVKGAAEREISNF